MRVLTISRGRLETARTQLRRPLITIGRSPTCDVILRAPGVAAIQYLIEWAGEGEFDPSQGMWSIVDAHTGEGMILGDEPLEIGDFVFRLIVDKLESNEAIGGKIQESLQEGPGARALGRGEMLELVQVRVDSGAIEEVRHVPVVRKPRRERLLRKVREFQVEWSGGDRDKLVRVLLEEMPGAEVYFRGMKMGSGTQCALGGHDLLQIRWRGRDFYLRLVGDIKAPPVPRDLTHGDRLLRQLLLGGLAFGFFFFALIHFLPESVKEEEKPPLRVARIEVRQVEAPVPPPAPPPKAVEAAPEQVKAKEQEPAPEKKVESAAPVKKAPKNSAPAKAAAPKFVSQPEAKPKAGLNSPAKPAQVNQVGILGLLNKMGTKGKGVQADKIINDGVVTETPTAPGQAKFVLKSAQSGVIGAGSAGNPNAKGNDLSAASTTLAGAGKYDPNSVGAIARQGGTSGMGLGAALKGSGEGGRGNAMGSLDSTDFSVEGGGLDRETVRRVIASYRGEIRTCYERVLLSNPNLNGRVVYHWRIDSDGKVVTTETKSSTLNSDALQSCVREVIGRMSFPKADNGKPTRVIYPFVFQGKK